MMEKTFRERELLEKQRRDFTNAMAHEMKTPLAVIRGFAENLEENTNEEKRAYYLEQIIGETEQMDEIVKEMVYVSELDADGFRPAEEEVSVRQLIEQEEERLGGLLEKKRLQFQLRSEGEFTLRGTPRLLEKAFSCLMSNAAEYSREEGRVIVTLTETSCVIENTGEKIPEEELPSVCEMFYTGSGGKNSGGKHLGMGLYLARRIFRSHGLEMKVENTEDGVRVRVER